MKYDVESKSYLAPKIWFIDPETIKTSKSLGSLKPKMRKLKPKFRCRLCKTYFKHVGLIWFCSLSFERLALRLW